MEKPIETIPWQQCSMQKSRNPQHKHAQGNLPNAKTMAYKYRVRDIHILQINQNLAKIERQINYTGIASLMPPASTHRLCIHLSLVMQGHVDYDFQATSLHIQSSLILLQNMNFVHVHFETAVRKTFFVAMSKEAPLSQCSSKQR